MCNQRLVGCLTFQCKRLSTCRFAFWFLCSLSFLIDSMGQAWDTTYKYITKSKKRRKKKNVSTVYEWRWVFMLGFGSRPHLIYMNVCIVSWCCVVLGNINMIAWKLGNGQCVASATHTHTHAITQVQTVFNIYLYRIYSFLLRIFVILLVRTNKHDTKFPKKNRTNVIGLVAFSMRALLYPMIDY